MLSPMTTLMIGLMYGHYFQVTLLTWTANGPLHCGVYEYLLSVGLECKHMIIWAKSGLVVGREAYHH